MEQQTDQFADDFNLGAKKEIPERNFADDPRCGFFPDMTDDEYFGDPIVEGSCNNSAISILIAETPLDFAYQHPRMNPDVGLERVAETVAMRRGDIVHQLALGKGNGYAVLPFNDFRTKAAKAARDEAIANGLTPMIESAFAEAQVMAEVLRHKFEVMLDGAPYQTEVAIVWKEETPVGEIYCRGRLDVWCPDLNIVIDPKITAKLGNGRGGREEAKWHNINMGWDRQAAFYCRGIERLEPRREGKVQFFDIMVKPVEPFTTRTVRHDMIWKRTSLYECLEPMELFAKCQASGSWPGYPDNEVWSLPPAEENRRLDREITT